MTSSSGTRISEGNIYRALRIGEIRHGGVRKYQQVMVQGIYFRFGTASYRAQNITKRVRLKSQLKAKGKEAVDGTNEYIQKKKHSELASHSLT